MKYIPMTLSGPAVRRLVQKAHHTTETLYQSIEGALTHALGQKICNDYDILEHT